MLNTLIATHPYWTLSFVAFLVNIPLGYIRAVCQKFTFGWLFWIHASIPLIIYLRISLGTSKLFIPVSIGIAVLGQILGVRLRQRSLTEQEKLAVKRIYDLNILLPSQPLNPQEVLVVLLNMGGPKDLDEIAMFQQRLFSDRRLIRLPLGYVWQRPFAWILSFVRLKVLKKRYAAIGGGSPIWGSTLRQRDALKQRLAQRGLPIEVAIAFNYSDPLPSKAAQEARRLQKKYILPLSLYPHYSQATTGSSLYYLQKALREDYPEGRCLPLLKSYHVHKGYIGAVVDRIQEALRPTEKMEDFYLLFSAHSLPLYCLKDQDPYPFQVAQTVGAVVAKLNRTRDWMVSYQSAVGPLPWIQPATDEVIKVLAQKGIKKLLVVPISFVNDHIETLYEINQEYRLLAEQQGISDFRMIKAIEDHQDFIKALADTVEEACRSLAKTTSLSS